VEKAGGVEDFDLEADILEFELQDVVRVKSMFIDIFIPAPEEDYLPEKLLDLHLPFTPTSR
jgi:hypothetical protein